MITTGPGMRLAPVPSLEVRTARCRRAMTVSSDEGHDAVTRPPGDTSDPCRLGPMNLDGYDRRDRRGGMARAPAGRGRSLQTDAESGGDPTAGWTTHGHVPDPPGRRQSDF